MPPPSPCRTLTWIRCSFWTSVVHCVRAFFGLKVLGAFCEEYDTVTILYMDGRYKKWQTKDRWLSCNKTQHTKIAWQRFIQRSRTTVHAREISRGREKGMKNGCFKAVMRHGCLGQRQWGTTCPNFVVWEAKHFFFCWLLRICAISHMCTSLVSSTTVAHISLTCVLLPAQIHKMQEYVPDLLI